MKSKFVFIAYFMAMCVFVFCCFQAFAQDGSPPPAFDWGFGSFAALVAAIPVVTELLKKMIKPLQSEGLLTQVFSWVIGLIITLTVWLLELGFLAGLPWWQMLLYGLGASLIANGIFDTGIISVIFGFFFKEE